ncbi:hypothetical protein MVEN_02153400 [Mycena venus]|uniref:Acid phosphatase n=1 Tax=Mycena venus TaxID=2733690 RepID=A0A8H6XAF8_9AGAR|nr:hypothetical protein MVEN_02153400 [Mycena venus]
MAFFALPLLFIAFRGRLVASIPAQVFTPPSPQGPLVQTANYTCFSNDTLNDPVVSNGKAFNRIIHIWLENTDFETTASTPLFETLAQQGIVLTNYNAVTHPSEPNYVAAAGGDFFGMHDDNMYHVPSNISTVVDLLEDKQVSWATYQESIPSDGFYGFLYNAPNYASPASGTYPYYQRKHNPLVIFDAISQDPARAKRIRSFNDFANDVVNGAPASALPAYWHPIYSFTLLGTLPQWVYITPNIVESSPPPFISAKLTQISFRQVNDGHDTLINYAASWLEYWFLPLLDDPRVNGPDTLILLTFDENETKTEQNRVWALAIGGAVPSQLCGTTDDTLYTHYSGLSTVQANWGLKSLGRQDTNASVSNVFSFVAQKTGYKNVNLPAGQVPMFNLSGAVPGPLTSALFVPFAAPDLSALGAGGDGVLIRPGLNTSLTQASGLLPPPVNMLALNRTTPWQMSPETTSGEHIIPCADALCT